MFFFFFLKQIIPTDVVTDVFKINIFYTQVEAMKVWYTNASAINFSYKISATLQERKFYFLLINFFLLLFPISRALIYNFPDWKLI